MRSVSPVIWRMLLGLSLSLLVAATAISNQSLWIDEANSALKAMQPSFSSFADKLLQDHGSDSQMPFYMFWLWSWEKQFGHGELSLRWANAPWLLLATLGILFCISEPRQCWTNLGLMWCNPFVWYYLNEARPYMLQYCGSLLLAVGIMNLASHNNRESIKLVGVWFLAFGAVLTGGASLLGMPFAGVALLICLFSVCTNRRDLRSFSAYLPLVTAFLIIFGLSFYYLQRLLGGCRATPNISGTRLNLIFCAYELLGFSGVGPGRTELRANAIGSLLDFKWQLALATLVLATSMLILLFRERRRPTPGQILLWSVYVIVPVGAILLVGVVRDFRVLGRHLTPILPCLLLALGCRDHRRYLVRISLVGVLGVWLYSALLLRFETRHTKDDYRSAAKVAIEALVEKKTVLWAANREAAEYYRVPLASTPQNGKALYSGSRETVDIFSGSSGHLAPEVVILSKPDLYDPRGTIRNMVRREGYASIRSLQAFEIWAK